MFLQINDFFKNNKFTLKRLNIFRDRTIITNYANSSAIARYYGDLTLYSEAELEDIKLHFNQITDKVQHGLVKKNRYDIITESCANSAVGLTSNSLINKNCISKIVNNVYHTRTINAATSYGNIHKLYLYRFFIKLYDSSAIQQENFNCISDNLCNTKNIKHIEFKRVRNLFVGRFTRHGLKERSIKLYTNAIMFIYQVLSCNYNFFYKTYNNAVDIQFMLFLFNYINLNKNDVDEIPARFKFLVKYNYLNKTIFNKQSGGFLIINEFFFYKILYNIAPTYTFYIHRTDKKTYKSSKGKAKK